MEGGKENIPRGKTPSVVLGKHFKLPPALCSPTEGRVATGPLAPLSVYFPRWEADLTQPLLYIWEVIRPWGGG